MRSAQISRQTLNWQIPAAISATVLAVSLVLVVPTVIDAQVGMASPSARNVQVNQHSYNEALIGFEHGDMHYPYVLGSLWSDADTPPESSNDS